MGMHPIMDVTVPDLRSIPPTRKRKSSKRPHISDDKPKKRKRWHRVKGIGLLFSIGLLVGSVAHAVTVPDVPSFSIAGLTVPNIPSAICIPPFNGMTVIGDIDPDDVEITVPVTVPDVPSVQVLSDAWGTDWGDWEMTPEVVRLHGHLAKVFYNDVTNELVFMPHCGQSGNTISNAYRVDMSSFTN